MPPVAAFVHQLSNEEIQHMEDIIHFGAVDNINIMKKEDTLMVEKLKAYLAELEKAKAEFEAPLDVTEIDNATAAYRNKLIAEAEAARAAEVAVISNKIDCVVDLITREEALVEAPVIEVAAPVVE